MKKFLIGLGLLALGVPTQAQSGLDNITVEKYYVANAADVAGSVGVLAPGSVTWRVYADLAAGYNLQAVYGELGTVTHNLVISTTTAFFNNEDRGATTPTAISSANTRLNTVMIDSWFSMGGNASTKVAVLKTEDSDGSIGNANGILANNDPSAGIPISTQDGMIAGTPPTVSFVGITNTGNGDLGVFDGTSQVGGLFSDDDGSIAVLGGVTGPTAANRILIGQFTTDGIFHFELNLQIGTPGGGTEKWVASNPQAGEFTMASLTGTFGAPNTPPTVSITAPSNGATYLVGNTVTIDATAADADGTVDSVEFFVDGVKIGSDLSSPYTINWTATNGAHALTAKATDNGGTVITSAAVNITVGNIIPPTVSISSPANGATFFEGASVTIDANAADADGTVDSVEFFVDGLKIGADLASPYTINWTSVIGTHSLTAKATDNHGATTTSSPAVSIQVFSSSASYALISSSNTCDQNVLCLPLNAIAPVSNVIGYDIQVNYDNTKVTPTGVVTVNNDLINPSYTSIASSINNAAGSMLISVFFNASAPPSAAFTGTGELLCVEFVKTANFGAVDVAQFSIASLQESYFTGVQPKIASPGSFSSFQDTIFQSSLKFWLDNSAIKYNAAVPTDFVITNIYGTDGSCNNPSAVAVQPDLSGNFNYNTINGQAISIEKNIPGTTDVQPVINGFDAFLTRRVLVNDPSFTPSVYQIIAMDVNKDGVISAGDLSQINQRTVLLIPEFKQAWNYDASGVSNGQPSKDWVFIDATTLNADPSFQVSSTFPANDGIGYSKSSVPSIPFCLMLPSFTSTICQTLGSEEYKGILLGDINGNYASYNTGPNAFRMSSEKNKVIFDVKNAVISNGYVEIPVKVLSEEPVNSVDFALQFNSPKLTFSSVIDHANLQSLINYNTADRTLRFTSFSLENINLAKAPVTVRFALNGDKITDADLQSMSAYINGERVAASARMASGNSGMVTIYPNPAREVLNVEVIEDATIQLLDMEGRQVIVQTAANANQKNEINIADIANGFYLLKVYNDSFVSTSKIVINH